MNFKELNHIINLLKPKHIISPYTSQAGGSYGPQGENIEESKVQQDSELSYQGENAIMITHANCVVDQVAKGQTITLTEAELGSLKYRGKCPTSIASLIKMQSAAGGIQLSRVTDL